MFDRVKYVIMRTIINLLSKQTWPLYKNNYFYLLTLPPFCYYFKEHVSLLVLFYFLCHFTSFLQIFWNWVISIVDLKIQILDNYIHRSRWFDRRSCSWKWEVLLWISHILRNVVEDRYWSILFFDSWNDPTYFSYH